MEVNLISEQCSENTSFTLDFELITTKKEVLQLKINNTGDIYGTVHSLSESDYSCTEQAGYCYIHVCYKFNINKDFEVSLLCSEDTSVNQEGIQLIRN